MGQRLGPYRLCVEIGSGGMATVFLAHREGVAGDPTSRWGYFAVKCARPHLAADAAFIGMFRDEARIASWIHHANVCSVFDFDVCDGTYFLAMEYLSGQTLKALLRKLGEPGVISDGGWHASIIARIVSDAAEGLHAAHELRDDEGRLLGVVHRDVSPENIFLTYDGNVKLMDFGLVRALGQIHETRTGVVKGKYGYVQPEVLQGKKPDRRSDVWSLGVVLWELLTARRLFAQETEAATLHAIADMTIPPPSKVREGLPRAIDAIVMRALDRDPAARYPTARALARDLTKFIARAGHGVGLADLADTMQRLYPSGAECDRQLLGVAHQIEEASIAWELAAAEPRAAEVAETKVRATFTPSIGSAAARGSNATLVAALAGGLALGGAMGWKLTDHADASPAVPPPPVVSASVQPDARFEVAPAPATSASAGRIELVGQDDLASGEMLLRVRVVPDDARSPRR
ncbi:MAG TPA: serine/threonine-protein kinase [Nannocystaceae bacterium]|nr:serine/threonine-protein kinase [Nannocystaceae bacterium]